MEKVSVQKACEGKLWERGTLLLATTWLNEREVVSIQEYGVEGIYNLEFARLSARENAPLPYLTQGSTKLVYTPDAVQRPTIKNLQARIAELERELAAANAALRAVLEGK